MFPYLLQKFGSLNNIDNKMERAQEDLLTGLCLGTMQYLSSDRLFIPFLTSFPELTQRSLHKNNPKLEFWPSWTDPQAILNQRQRIEPDWVVRSSSTVVVGESKYNADFIPCQLKREWELAQHRFGDTKEVFLAGISSHSIEPDLQDELNDINWLWTNWQTIVTVVHQALSTTKFDLEPYEERLLNDLRDTIQQFGIYSTYVFDSNFKQVDRATFPYTYDTPPSATKSEHDSLSRIANTLPVNISSIPGGYRS